MYNLLNSLYMVSDIITIISFTVLLALLSIGILIVLLTNDDYGWVFMPLIISFVIGVGSLVVTASTTNSLPKYTEGTVQVTNQLTNKRTSYQDIHDFKQLTNDSKYNDAGIYRMVDKQGKTIKVYVSPKEAENAKDTCFWRFAKEIEPIEVTLVVLS